MAAKFLVDIGRVVVTSDTETPATVHRLISEALAALVIPGITWESEATVVVWPVRREIEVPAET